jgi:hypothetical protein
LNIEVYEKSKREEGKRASKQLPSN